MATNTYVELDKVTVAGTSTTTVTFSLIPSTYTDLVIVGNLGSETTNAFPYLQFNGDTGSNYSYTELYGNGTNAYSVRVSNNTQLFNNDVSVKQGSLNSNVVYHIMNYANTTTYKTSLTRQNTVDAADYNGALAAVGLWRNTAAITSVSIKLTRGGTAYNFSNGSTFSLYGISAIGGVTPKATGGTVTSDATYWYHTFEMSGDFVPNQSLSCDYLVVAGGGGGGNEYGGGGGAGGYKTSIGGSQLSVTAQRYPVTIGGGGAGGNTTGIPGTNGSNSIFASITSTGGGGGGCNTSTSSPPNGLTGGSGGGGGVPNYGGGSVYGSGGGASPSGEGNVGGAGGRLGGGGGGGAGGAGANFKTPLPGTQVAANEGNGGIGLVNNITGTSVYYAGGGGGIGWSGSTVGGLGGGGNGAHVDNVAATAGSPNTGGGGGGGGPTATTPARSGGSGIVVIRYAK